jgi:hypothetical protein
VLARDDVFADRASVAAGFHYVTGGVKDPFVNATPIRPSRMDWTNGVSER